LNNNPIGILDSGLGGLTVLKEIGVQLPNESTVYIGDSQNAPYGSKTKEEIYQLAKRLVEFLLENQVKLIVVACNTITVSCISALRDAYPTIPIVGTVPVIKTAGTLTKNRRIGILSTTRTATSAYQKQLIEQFASDCQVISHGTDLLVPLIEKGETKSEKMIHVLERELAIFQKGNVDVLVLGSTHFPFLRDQIQEMLGPKVSVIDSGTAIARRVKWILENNNIVTTRPAPEYLFYTTGNTEIAKKLLAGTIAEGNTFSLVYL